MFRKHRIPAWLKILAVVVACSGPLHAATVAVKKCDASEGETAPACNCTADLEDGEEFIAGQEYLVIVQDAFVRNVRIRKGVKGSLRAQLCTSSQNDGWEAPSDVGTTLLSVTNQTFSGEVKFTVNAEQELAPTGTQPEIYSGPDGSSPLTITTNCDVPTILDPVPAVSWGSRGVLAIALLCAFGVVLALRASSSTAG